MNNIQNYVKNTRFEILTPAGEWDDFSGVIRNTGDFDALVITFDNQIKLVATPEHRLFTDGCEKACSELAIGDTVDGKNDNKLMVTNLTRTKINAKYDIFNSDSHKILCYNSVGSHQCDEFSFVATNKASEFFTSIQPTLSTGGACIITSTPKSDVDQFAQIYKGAIDNTDEFGNPNPKGVGKNGFFAVTIPWWHHPERDEEWAKTYRDQLGENRFRQEFACCSSDCIINIENNSIKKDMTMGELFNLLKMGTV